MVEWNFELDTDMICPLPPPLPQRTFLCPKAVNHCPGEAVSRDRQAVGDSHLDRPRVARAAAVVKVEIAARARVRNSARARCTAVEGDLRLVTTARENKQCAFSGLSSAANREH